MAWLRQEWREDDRAVRSLSGVRYRPKCPISPLFLISCDHRFFRNEILADSGPIRPP